MSTFVLTLTGFAGTMGIRTFAAAVADDVTSAVTGVLHPQAKAIVKRDHAS